MGRTRMRQAMQKFEPFQKVLVRNRAERWSCDLYSHKEKSPARPHYVLSGYRFEDEEILPYAGNEHLLGTKDSPTPKWEPKPGELVAVRNSIQDAWVARNFYGKSASGDFQFRCETEDQDERIGWKFCEPLRKHFTIPEE